MGVGVGVVGCWFADRGKNIFVISQITKLKNFIFFCMGRVSSTSVW